MLSDRSLRWLKIIFREFAMVASTVNDEKPNEKNKPEDFRTVIYTFPRPLFSDK